MEKKLLLNDGWKFTKQKIGTSLQSIHQDNPSWSEIDLPHDWLIYNTDDLYEDSEGWYKRELFIKDLSGACIRLYFEGVYMDSTVFVNGQKAGEWKYGYSSFEFDITGLLKEGSNELIVRAVHQSPNSRWYSGAGIYRNVWLIRTAPLHLVTDGIYIATKKETNSWYAEIETEVINSLNQKLPVEAVIRHTILNRDGTELIFSENKLSLLSQAAKDQQFIAIKEPFLWDPKSPYLHQLKTELILNGTVIDEELQNFGFRTTRFDPKEGFFINDRHIKLHGACQHHDLGSLGAATNKTALHRQLMILMDMGVNAIRLSHNMPSVEMMELADELGLLIVSESFDMWEHAKTTYDYSRFFKEWYAADVASWIRRDRNHPSIIMWSIGNEIHDTSMDKRGLEVTKLLKEQVLIHDPKKNGQVTIGSNFMTSERAQNCSAELLAAGYNYAERLYQEHHEKYPDWYIYGSETASTLQSRGIYHFPLNKTVVIYEDEQCSSLGNCSTSWGSKNTEANIIYDRDASFSMGQFIWTGFDYIGEPTPYNTKNSYFGQVDTAGFPKDSYYIYQAEWTDYKEKPMVHLLPYWDFNEGQLIDVVVYSNAPKVELFFNEISQGTFEIDHAHGKELSGKWQLPYHPGTLKAVAYDEKGTIIATDTRASFGDTARICLKPDKEKLMANGEDLIFLEISAKDAKGNPVANANNRITVEVTGSGRLVGLDNGDSTDYDQYKGNSRRLFSGKLLAIIAAKTSPGEITVKVTSTGLPDEELTFTALPSVPRKGISAYTENFKSIPNPEIPIRKIELLPYGSTHLNKENQAITISARLLPENTTYPQIQWKAINHSGLETNIALIEVDGHNAKITALGDGEFRLRCISKNGGRSSCIISDLEFTITGMGTLTSNPYEFMDAALYHTSNHQLDSGFMGGIDTKEDTDTIISYEKLNFGDYGADEITIPICYQTSTPIPFEIWEGIPKEEDSVLLLNASYEAEAKWATFQTNTFKLKERIKGITTISFVFHHKMNIQGFVFTKIEKAYAELSALDNNQIYGDSYTITDEIIKHIGNNVSIVYDNMDFGEDGPGKLILCGKGHCDNLIHVRFESPSGTICPIIEFPACEEVTQREYKLSQISKTQKVTFIFMPGCNFDLHWFQFIK